MGPANAPLVYSTPYRAGTRKKKLKREEVLQMEKAGVAQTALTKRASPIVFIPEMERCIRIFVYHRRLSAFNVLDSYPIPSMDKNIDFLGKAKKSATSDASYGYWQVEID